MRRHIQNPEYFGAELDLILWRVSSKNQSSLIKPKKNYAYFWLWTVDRGFRTLASKICVYQRNQRILPDFPYFTQIYSWKYLFMGKGSVDYRMPFYQTNPLFLGRFLFSNNLNSTTCTNNSSKSCSTKRTHYLVFGKRARLGRSFQRLAGIPNRSTLCNIQTGSYGLSYSSFQIT